MMKWLREHTKKIMVGVVLFAMFSFVGGSALTSLFQQSPADLLVMSSFDEDFSLLDIQNAEAETQILDRLFIDWTSGNREEITIRHWIMLAKEAERAGITISNQDVNEFLTDRDALVQQMGGGSLADIRKQLRVSLGAMQSAVAKQMAIGENFQRVNLASFPSEPQVKHFVKATEDKVSVAFAALDAEKFIDAAETITPEELQAQFEKYKDVSPDESPDGFGYKHPRRVRLQYVAASIGKLESQVDVSSEEVKNHWKANQDKYKKNIVVDEPIIPTSTPADSQPASQPATRKVTKQVPKPYSECRDQITAELRKNKAAKLARQSMSRLAEELGKPWTQSKIDEETGFRPIPKAVEDPAYLRSVAAQVGSRFGVTLDYAETDLSSAEDIAKDFVLQKAETPGDEDAPLSLSEFAFRVPGFFKPEKNDESTLRLQLFQTPIIPMTVAGMGTFRPGPDGNWRQVPGEPTTFILFRVIETRESQPPAVIEEVARKVERDVRLLKAYARIEPISRELAAVASRVGIDVALTYFEDLRTNRGIRIATKPEAFSRMVHVTDREMQEQLVMENRPVLEYSEVPPIGRLPEFIDACFEMTREDYATPTFDVPQSTTIQAASTQPASMPAPKIQWVAVPKSRKFFVIELLSKTPVNTENYESEKRQLAFNTLAGDRGLAARLAWFNPEKIQERCKYVPHETEASARSKQGMYSTKAPPPFMGY